ncbi:MAG: hypothetical protein KKD77_22275 [Gammaproteobacteria bacterium]|nr:hypothetical protein [Gammaproteobacteria bacterium]
MNTKEELFKARDALLSSIRSFLTTYAMIGDTKRFKDFVKYINRYTASEVQFLIEEHGLKGEIEKIIDQIENCDTSITSKKEDEML